MKVILVLLAMLSPLLAQDDVHICVNLDKEIIVCPQKSAHGEYDLTVKDIVIILAEFDVKHVAQQPFFAPAYGVTDFDSNPPAIWIFNTSDTLNRRSTVIHELLHAHYREAGMNPPEAFIASEEERLYRKVFGLIE